MEKTNPDTGSTCKLHTEKPLIRIQTGDHLIVRHICYTLIHRIANAEVLEDHRQFFNVGTS